MQVRVPLFAKIYNFLRSHTSRKLVLSEKKAMLHKSRKERGLDVAEGCTSWVGVPQSNVF